MEEDVNEVAELLTEELGGGYRVAGPDILQDDAGQTYTVTPGTWDGAYEVQGGKSGGWVVDVEAWELYAIA